MWVSGIMQGLMWRAYDSLGFLEYSFIETVEAMHPFYVIRAFGGAAVPDRRADHGLQLWRTIRGDEIGRGGRGPCRPRRAPPPSPPAE
jgi:cytochrome c oxidase cbb3-type subunit I